MAVALANCGFFSLRRKKPSGDDRRLAEQAAVADVRLAVHARRGVREPDERIRRHQQVPHDVHAFGREVGGRPIHNVGDTVDDRPAAKFVNARRGGPATDRWIGRYFSTMKDQAFRKPLLSSSFTVGDLRNTRYVVLKSFFGFGLP